MVVLLPYVVGVSKGIRQVCKRFGMRVVFRSGQTFHSILTRVGYLANGKAVQGRTLNSIQLWPGLHWGGNLTIGDQDEGTLTCRMVEK